MNLEGTLVEKLRRVEALHAGTTVDGEREAIHDDVTEAAETDVKALPGGGP